MRYSKVIIVAGSILVGAALSAIAWLKLSNFQYNAMDSAIFVNVLENFLAGRGFFSSTQGGSYFADHFSPIILLPAAWYYLWRSPIGLLVFQVLMAILPVWPLYLIARKKLSDKNALLVVFAYLFNPLVWNLAIFEFELLPIAIFFLLMVYYFHLQKRWWPFLICLVLAMLVREDVALWLVGFGVWSWWRDRQDGQRLSRYSLTSFLAGVTYFLAAILAIRLIGGGYKFTEYYSLQNIWSWSQLELVVGLLLPLAFLPLLRPRALLPTALIYLQFLCLGGLGAIVVKTHYSSLFIPTLFFAFIESLRALESPRGAIQKFFANFYQPIVIVTIVYSFIVLGPVRYLGELERSAPERTAMSYLLEQVPTTASVAASYDFLTPLAARPQVYSLNYVFLGTKQFSRERYNAHEVDYVLWNSDDLLTYQLQYKQHQFYEGAYSSGALRIEDYLSKFDLVFQVDNFYLFRNKKIVAELPEYLSPAGYRVRSFAPLARGESLVSFYDTEGRPLGSASRPMNLQLGVSNYQVPVMTTKIKIQPVTVAGFITLNGVGSSVNIIRATKAGEAAEISF